MSLSYTLVVTSPLYGKQGSATALNFANSLVAEGHQLKTVFFYLDGVTNSLSTSLPASDEVDIHQCWIELKNNSGCELLVCSAAAYRRGVVAKEDLENQAVESFNMSHQFAMSGLAEMATAMLSSDRVVQL
ncbi:MULTISPECIES: sulfurtransferase complex subunit TusD [unclassified Agarivorans]|uniref:sulfurtransferase complex subunit TusD n=1 Tax=unclassified Agarivorans TaxID=2636026 RepID=UPI0026E2AD62|nr:MULTISPECIES: sulfurtransferase complex subunit TusD [unclassified Agarivorans]MDO6687420.1 sulfurtransferase complex subunit TusD [Agarivorans sp. 3_MG-2023]MDO6715186.1 sulfurtransferase complex subunit TusD [Agarivorans sp. 2_MG-2023]